jgi:hypothetical protein
MSAPQARSCRVLNGEKLPPESGGAAAICSAIEQAISAKGTKVAYKADVHVLSPSGLAVNLEVGGRKLEEQHFGIMDRNINPSFIKRVAETVADQVVSAARNG